MASLQSVLFGQDPDDVELPPEVAAAAAKRAQLSGVVGREALGAGPTMGQQAVLDAGQAAAERAGQRIAGRAAGARGFGAIAARAQANRLAPQAEQQTMGQTILAAGQQRAADQARAQNMLGRLITEEEAAALREDELRRARAGGGLLPVLTAGLGAGIGGLAGGAQGAGLGAQIGGLGGTAAASQFR